jgi:cytochrome c peroxidase
MISWKLSVLPALIVLVAACSDGNGGNGRPAEPQEPDLDAQLQALIEDQELTGDPSAGRELPSIEDPLAQLGMLLFFSQSLGGETDSACVTCHHPALGGGDDLSLPIGVQAELPELLGPGRMHSSSGFGYDGGPTVPRNAPTTFNMAMWDEVLFHDGRVESLGKTPGANGADGQGIRTPDFPFDEADPNAENLTQAQALFPVTSAEEMRAEFLEGASNEEVRNGLMQRLIDQSLPNSWLEEFQAGFESNADAEELMTYQNASLAIASYENSQLLVDTPWKAYVDGDQAALSEQQKQGALLFFNTIADDGADCAACHSGDFFTDEGFHVLATPQLGRGKGDGDFEDNDFGRFRETDAEADRYAFRTPSLLNVSATGPWTHAGAYQDLESIVRHHLSPPAAVDAYDFSLSDLQPGMQGENAEYNTRQALEQLARLQDEGTSKLSEVTLTDEQVAALGAFLQALTDPCVEDAECISKWVADRDSSGPDSLQLNGVDEAGEPL